MERAQRLCEAGLADTEYWLRAVAFNDAMTEYFADEYRLYGAALAAGTAEQWTVVKHHTEPVKHVVPQ